MRETMEIRIGDLQYRFLRNDAGTITVYCVEDGREQPVLETGRLEDAVARVLTDYIGEEVEVRFE